jgi:hypothetical protein
MNWLVIDNNRIRHQVQVLQHVQNANLVILPPLLANKRVPHAMLVLMLTLLDNRFAHYAHWVASLQRYSFHSH